MPKRKAKTLGTPRERLVDAAYDLFATKGVNRVGIDTILALLGRGPRPACTATFAPRSIWLSLSWTAGSRSGRGIGWKRKSSSAHREPEGRGCSRFSTCSTPGSARRRSRAARSSTCCWNQTPVRRSGPLPQLSPGKDPRDREGAGAGSRFARARESCPGLAYVDEGLDRFSGRRPSQRRARRQEGRQARPRRLATPLSRVLNLSGTLRRN